MTLRLSTPDEGLFHRLDSVLSVVPSLAPGLEELTLYEPHLLAYPVPQRLVLSEVALQAVAKCTRLQRLSAIGCHLVLDHHFLIMLAALPQLRHLCVIASDLQAGGMGTVQRSTLTMLETLELTTPGESFPGILRLVQTSKLRKLSLRCRDRFMSLDRWVTYFERFSLNTWSSTVCIVRLWFDFVTSSTPETLTQWIQPLMTIRSLERLEIRILENTALGLFDDDALSISQSWPHLTAFFLLYETRAPASGQLSHRSLQYFADNCPGLEELVLPGICDTDIDHHAHLPRPHPQNRLKTLLFGPHVYVRCMKCFARYVHTMFPNIHAYGRASHHVRYPYHKYHCEEFWKALCSELQS